LLDSLLKRFTMEVSCDLVRGPVYLTGEDISCWVKISNDSESAATLGWVSAQLNCFCSVSSDKVTNIEPPSRKISVEAHNLNKTSFQPTQGESGLAVLSTKTKVLACSLEVLPGETKKFLFSENIPYNAPPSFRGHSVKYSYKLCIGSQKLGEPSSLLRLPFRVLSVDSYTPHPKAEEEDRMGPSNPFLEPTNDKDPVLDLIMQSVQEHTSRKNASYFVIANSRGKVCKFCLYKKNFRLGEDIVGSFNFTVGDVECLQYSVSLQSIESVEPKFRVNEDQPSKVVNQSKQHEVCLGFSQSHLILPIPLHLTPSFSTNICRMEYRLHFEFVSSVSGLEKQEIPDEAGGSEWQGPAKVDIETMVWDLPVTIFPTFPTHAALHTNIPTSASAPV